jgi:ribosomal protein S18 acetylase RimI-like enzyme
MVPRTGHHFEVTGADRLDHLRDLWLELHRHHRSVVRSVPLVEDDEHSWQRRRALYFDRLRAGTAFVVLALEGEAAIGYAVVCLEEGPDDTFPLADRYAELYSLVVADRLRGRGLGSELLDFVDQELASRGIHDLKVAVMRDNPDALRLYERRGFVPAEVVLYRFGAGRG